MGFLKVKSQSKENPKINTIENTKKMVEMAFIFQIWNLLSLNWNDQTIQPKLQIYGNFLATKYTPLKTDSVLTAN